jgi:hypothetical protein
VKGALEPIDSASHPALSGVLAPVDEMTLSSPNMNFSLHAVLEREGLPRK